MAAEAHERRHVRYRVFDRRTAPRRNRRHGFGKGGRLRHAVARSGFGDRHHPGRSTLLHRQPHGDGSPLLQIDLVDLVFALAAASLLFAATRRSASGNPRTAGVIVTLSTATLGFYVMQSLASSLWRPVFNTLLANILVSQNSPAAICIITGTVISIVFALALLIIDAARSLIVRKLKRQ